MTTTTQGTPEWLQDRSGKWTGSKFVDVLAKSKTNGKPLKARSDCVWQVVVERMTGVLPDEIKAAALQWGKDVEPFAREAYELETGFIVQEVGFLNHPLYPFAGCSPDGLVGDDGAIEMKCPKDPSVHLKRFLDGMEADHLPQVQGGLWVTGRKWWDFISYDPRMPPDYRMFKVRVLRDESYIANLEKEVLIAETEANELLAKFTKAAA